jgi:hypothetical protein
MAELIMYMNPSSHAQILVYIGIDMYVRASLSPETESRILVGISNKNGAHPDKI